MSGKLIPIHPTPAVTESALLHVSFEDALRIEPLLEMIGRSAEAEVQILLARSGDFASLTGQGVRAFAEHGKLLVEFTEKARKLYGARGFELMRDAGGRYLPKLVGSGGKVVANARTVTGLARLAPAAAGVVTAVVTASHVVSGLDLSRKLDRQGKRIDFLVAARRMTQLSRLEAVYRHARELASLPQSEARQMELHRLGRELFELRADWRREVVHRLENLENPKESNNALMRWLRSLSRSGKDKRTTGEITQSEIELRLMDFSFALHIGIAQTAGTLDAFLSISLPDELRAVARVKDTLFEKRGLIHEKHAELREQVGSTDRAFGIVVERYERMVMSPQPREMVVTAAASPTRTRRPKRE